MFDTVQAFEYNGDSVSQGVTMNSKCAVSTCRGREYSSGFCQVHYKWLRSSGGLTDEDRFWSYVTKTSGCWYWNGPLNNQGYGHLHFGLKKQICSRISWSIVNGPIPAGMVILHKCDTPSCVNPEHLALGTQADNVADMHAKGRARKRGLVGEQHIKAKLSPEQVKEIRESTEKGVTLAARFNVTPNIISRVRSGKSYFKTEVEHIRPARHRNVLTDEIVRSIRASDEPGFILANRFSVSQATICDIRKRRSWTHIP